MARTYAKKEAENRGNSGNSRNPNSRLFIDRFGTQADKKNEISEAYNYMISHYTQKDHMPI